jgi:hypothetical protein
MTSSPLAFPAARHLVGHNVCRAIPAVGGMLAWTFWADDMGPVTGYLPLRVKVLGRALAPVLAIALIIAVAGCSHAHRSSAPGVGGNRPLATPSCASVSSTSGQHDAVEFIQSPPPHGIQGLIQTLTARLLAVGGACPTVTLEPTATLQDGLPAPAATLRLHLHWTGGPGADMQFRPNLSYYLLRSGTLAIRTVGEEVPIASCPPANSNLLGVDASVVVIGDRCFQLGPTLLRGPKVLAASAVAASDGSHGWTVRMTFDHRATARLRSSTGRAAFAWVGGFPLGEAVIPANPGALTIRTHFDGGETEATAVAANLWYPTAEIIGVAGTS